MTECSFLLVAGTSHAELAREVAAELSMDLAPVLIENFPDGEIGVQLLESVRGKDVFVLQTLARRPNHYFMELLILVDALKRASARSVIAVIPYYGYARQDRKEKARVPITAKLVANLLERAGVNRVVTLDLHTEQIQGFFDIPLDHLYARPLFVQALKEQHVGECVVVSTDVGSNKMARRFAEELGADFAMVDKRRVDAQKVSVQSLIGDVRGKAVLLVDDICSTGDTLKKAARVCKKRGALRVMAAVSHGLMIGDVLEGGWIDQVLISNSIPKVALSSRPGIKEISIAPLLARAIECIVAAESVSAVCIKRNG